MSFLSGWGSIALAAGLTIPPLVALYFLKLRRQPVTVASTLLWKRAVEDLQVNAPFQRIRNNLLLWLQLLILLLAAFALGMPVLRAQKSEGDTIILLLDQSASMSVEEAPNRTRLDEAIQQARTVVDNAPQDARIMVIGFSDRASIISSFETDKNTIKRKLDHVRSGDGVTTLSEAVTLSEAYMQNLVIAGDVKGADIEVQSSARPARLVILTDGNIRDARQLRIKHLPTQGIEVISVGQRADNVAILSMDTRRNYEKPQMLEVFALVRNFGHDPVTLDAALYINDEHTDVQTVTLAPGIPTGDRVNGADGSKAGPPAGSVASITFDEIEFEGGGVVEVRLSVHDALAVDNRAWSVVQPSRHVSVLLVSEGDFFLERLLASLPIRFDTITPQAYAEMPDDELTVAGRLRYDVVIFENYSTDRLPPGSYIFFGGVPKVDGVKADGFIDDEIIFNWDETNPILRYVAVDTIQVYRWLRLTLPAKAVTLIEGETSPIMATLADGPRRFLICAFGLLTRDDVTGQPMLNTNWMTKVHFLIFVYNAIQNLSGSLSATGLESIRPGQPIEFPAPQDQEQLHVRRPDGDVDTVIVGGFESVNYARTRRVGVYRATDGLPGRNTFAVNLFDTAESNIQPKKTLELSGENVTARSGAVRVNKPVWPWILLAVLGVLVLEWAIYSRRVYV